MGIYLAEHSGRPPTVTAELVAEPRHPWCVASIVIDEDPRLHSPHYSLHVGREEPVLLSHAQLAALMLAARELIARAPLPEESA